MRTTRALAVSAVAAAAVGLAAPAASAWTDPTPSNITATPSVIPRGGQLTVSVDSTKCQDGSGRVSSDAFDTGTLSKSSGSTATATVKVHHNAAPGTHAITVTCTGASPVTKPDAFTVIGGGVRGGLGGSSETGATRTDMAIGGGLVAVALVGGGVFWMRRRADNRA
ncbi:hypothetical protein GTW43_26315 [Streptomyces sp. SID5785]|uniref:hypothetical protein n=1 Tax=Streptomyces sp. SID5785 TaxID=2690309 RepID=UPI001360E3B7|nr:hypothetical protein [Streptomyces sp. SID5785]MZD08567.1 hypothetical protein [Streptomyces sp. SID5785]